MRHAATDSEPIADHEALKPQFIFQNSIQELAIPACVAEAGSAIGTLESQPGCSSRIVHHLIGAHDRAHMLSDALGKRPKVQLVQRPVVDIGGHRIGQAPLEGPPEVFLFISYIMFRYRTFSRTSFGTRAKTALTGGNDTSVLNTPDGLGCADRLQHRVGPETYLRSATSGHRAMGPMPTFPISTAGGVPPQRTHCRAEQDVDALETGLRSMCSTPLIHEPSVPGGTCGDSGWESGDVVRKSNT